MGKLSYTIKGQPIEDSNNFTRVDSSTVTKEDITADEVKTEYQKLTDMGYDVDVRFNVKIPKETQDE